MQIRAFPPPPAPPGGGGGMAGLRCVCEKTWWSVHCRPGRYRKERRAGQYRRAQGQVGMGGGGGGCTYGSAESSVTAGQWARWCDRDKMAEQCVVGERFCGRCSDLQLIVYRLLVRLSLQFQMTKDLTIPKFGVLSYSLIYKRRETVSVNIFVEVICSWLYTDCWWAKSLVPNDKSLTIPKFGVLSYSSIYKRRETVSSAYTYYM